MRSDMPISLLSVDVEDWFHVDNLKAAITRDSWSERELRVERNVNIILDVLDKNSTKGTFFMLGWVVERSPDLVKTVHARGHEIAAHGFAHDSIYDLSPAKFQSDVAKSKCMLEDLTGVEVIGYRAPNFSITDWAIDVLQELGFSYDSSLYPTMVHDRYGKLSGVQLPVKGHVELRSGFFEVLLSTLPVFGQNIPWSGGAYFRIIPYTLFKNGVKAILSKKEAYCFYIHPWEFDPDQPRVSNINAFYRFRHYCNLNKTLDRFTRLVQDFKFQPIKYGIPLGLAR